MRSRSPDEVAAPEERPTEPPTGYKIAHPVLSRTAPGPGSPVCRWAARCRTKCWTRRAACTGLRHRAPHRRLQLRLPLRARLGHGRGHALHQRHREAVLPGGLRPRRLHPLRTGVPLRPANGCGAPRSVPAPVARWPPRSRTRAGGVPAGAPSPACAGCVRGRTSCRWRGSPGWPVTGCGSAPGAGPWWWICPRGSGCRRTRGRGGTAAGPAGLVPDPTGTSRRGWAAGLSPPPTT